MTRADDIVALQAALRDRDREIAKLRQRLDDQFVELASLRAMRQELLQIALPEEAARIVQPDPDDARPLTSTSNARLRVIFDSLDVGVVVVNREGVLTLVNRCLGEMMGRPQSEAVGAAMTMFMVPEEHEGALDRLMEMFKAPHHEERQLPRPDGSTIWISVDAAPLRDGSSPPQELLAIVTDITDRREAQESLKSTLAELEYDRILLDAVGEAVIATDLDGVVTYWNHAAERLYGWTYEEAIGQRIIDLTPPSGDVDPAAKIAGQLATGTAWSGEIRVHRKDGSEFTANVTSAPITGTDGQPIGVVGVSSDLTERHFMERQLRQAQKLEAIGQLAGGVAHDFNNLITAILGNADLLLDQIAESDSAHEHVLEILNVAQRGAELTQQLLAFSRHKVNRVVRLDLEDVIENLVALLRRLLRANIELTVDIASDLDPIEADRTQVEQLIMNLVINAGDAAPDGGELNIEVKNLTDGDGSWVRMRVSDVGVGILAETLDHIFEAFFTTKGEFGTGLGLATVASIVDQSRGRIAVESEVGVGTTFLVDFPSAESLQAPSEATSIVPTAPSRRPVEDQTILVCEDEGSVLRLISMILSAQGYTIIEADCGEVGRSRAASDAAIDLLLTDVSLPDVDGPTLARELMELRPNMKVVVMSGYSDGDHAIRGGLPFLQKPFTPADLLSKVRDALE